MSALSVFVTLFFLSLSLSLSLSISLSLSHSLSLSLSHSLSLSLPLSPPPPPPPPHTHKHKHTHTLALIVRSEKLSWNLFESVSQLNNFEKISRMIKADLGPTHLALNTPSVRTVRCLCPLHLLNNLILMIIDYVNIAIANV